MLLEGAIPSPKSIRPLNDVPATGTTEDSSREGENSSNQLPEIDDTGSSKQATTTSSKPTASPKPTEPPPRSLEPSELPRPPEKVSEPFEEPEDDEMLLDPSDQMQLDLVVSNLCYRVAKTFKKKVDRNPSTPNSYKQALQSPNVNQWLEAIFKEFEQLISSRTIKFLPYEALPEGRKPLTSRLVFKEKLNEYNETVKFKVRLVVRGFMQVEGVDYTETFASTTIPSTWRILMALAAIYD